MLNFQEGDSKELESVFRNLIVETGMPLKVFAKAAGIRSESVLTWYSKITQPERFAYKHLKNFSETFGFSEESIFHSTYDRALLRKRFLGPVNSLPDRYQENADSYIRSSYYIIEYLTLLYGKQAVDKILFDLKVHPTFVDNVNNKVSILFVMDLLRACQKLGFKERDFKSLAGSMFLSVEKDQLQSLLTGVDRLESFMYVFPELCSYFDMNFEYKFNVGISGVEIINKPSDSLMKLVSNKQVDIKLLEFYRNLLYNQSPKLVDLPEVSAEVNSSLSSGHSFVRHMVRFNSFE